MGAGSSIQNFEATQNISLSPEQHQKLSALYAQHQRKNHLSVAQLLHGVDESDLDVTERQYIRFVAKQIALELSERALRDAINSLSHPTAETQETTQEAKEQEPPPTTTPTTTTTTTTGEGSKTKK